MLPRVLEPEVMDTAEEARDYDAMDFAEVNRLFVADALAFHGPVRGGWLLDIGTGTARIPIEFCRQAPAALVIAADLSRHMLELGRRNVADAGLDDRISLELVDAKGLPYADGFFEAVLSNSIIHHIPTPYQSLAEMVRLVMPGGTLFIRDLARPHDQATLDRLLDLHAGHESAHGRAMFRDSLKAALTLDEIRDLLASLGVPGESVDLTSDRHWTCTWRKPRAAG